MTQVFFLVILCCQSSIAADDAGLFAKALWFLQAFGEPICSRPQSDQYVKSILAKALARDRECSMSELEGLISEKKFAEFATKENKLTEKGIEKALAAETPESRLRLNDELRKHAELLTTSFDMIDREHIPELEKLAEWIAAHWQSTGSLHVLVTCTGNSRRSILGTMMGNFAAAYYGLDNVHFHSGGTIPSAFNKRTITTLEEIGFQIEPTGQEAVRGDAKTPNLIYRVVWGKDLESLEFSKLYKDKTNPQSGFAVILVCSEADEECRTVPGAALRLSMTFIDPKLYDDGNLETKKYAERRDDIGRTMLAVMAIARRRIQERVVATK
jgi:arsenate reductase (thioredoxin)